MQDNQLFGISSEAVSSDGRKAPARSNILAEGLAADKSRHRGGAGVPLNNGTSEWRLMNKKKGCPGGQPLLRKEGFISMRSSPAP